MSQRYTSDGRSEHVVNNNLRLELTIWPASPFRLLDLPTEVRGLIYQSVFQDMVIKHVGGISNSRLLWPGIAILFVSRLCFEEARPILLTTATFYVDPDRLSRPAASFQGMSFLRAISTDVVLSPVELRTVKHVSIDTDSGRNKNGDSLPGLLTSLPNLESAVLHQPWIPSFIRAITGVEPAGDGAFELHPENLDDIRSFIEDAIAQGALAYVSAPWSHDYAYSLVRIWHSSGRRFAPILVLRLQCYHKLDILPRISRHYHFDIGLNLKTRFVTLTYLEDKGILPSRLSRHPTGPPQHSFMLSETAVEAFIASACAANKRQTD
ncbi:uncharacterized protein AB675_7293 [Cyphellophora attinorum]|uniref:F-box domain-containing protein n=1 Tax=Cyphellophora attinorum TaxID=1664694 RepID=A0A0N1GZ71_9EURO|nr:uncharacterized protein AB675_7293 [Phialophora attinorum]KPI36242.1 hypothetical protein AB675_7293 [Phialophora attinorum]